MILQEDLVPEHKVKVRVIDKYRVVDPFDAKGYIKGETLTVAEDVAEDWVRNGYVERVSKS
jgi:hypothetical protein